MSFLMTEKHKCKVDYIHQIKENKLISIFEKTIFPSD
jgi:hypothetical protein